VVLGGPFLHHIERIIRGKAESLNAPVVSASDPGNRSVLKHFFSGPSVAPRQLCDVMIHIEKDIRMFIEMRDVSLRLLGMHQLRNAVTATCAALCLRQQGWEVSDSSFRRGLQSCYLVGRTQFLTSEEVERLGFPRSSTILLDGAHTKESGEALKKTIETAFPSRRLAVVVAMADDKDHVGFASAMLSSGVWPDVACFTEVDIAGERFRTVSSSSLMDSWIRTCRRHRSGNAVVVDDESKHEVNSNDDGKSILLARRCSVVESMRFANGFVNAHGGIVVVTGSLHIVAAVL
ncbi:hypothetical protein M569_14285, partial [Genlisea aurea]